MYCIDGCCNFTICPVKKYKTIPSKTKQHRKGGVVIFNSLKDKILLVQSRGKMWGFAKGSLEIGETIQECAIRELKEETGIILTINDILNKKKISVNKSLYFMYDTLEENGTVQDEDPFNDVNGIGWIKMECLQKLYKNTDMKLNYQCRFILTRFFKQQYYL